MSRYIWVSSIGFWLRDIMLMPHAEPFIKLTPKCVSLLSIWLQIHFVWIDRSFVILVTSIYTLTLVYFFYLPFGRTRAMNKLLEHLTTAQQICCVISALKPNTIKLSKNTNGCHVMEHCFRQFSSDYNKVWTDYPFIIRHSFLGIL